MPRPEDETRATQRLAAGGNGRHAARTPYAAARASPSTRPGRAAGARVLDGRGCHAPNNVTRAWGRALRCRGLPPVGFHSLRHSHASALIRAGVDILIVRRRLGHAKANITLDTYGHLFEGADAAAAKAIGEALK